MSKTVIEVFGVKYEVFTIEYEDSTEGWLSAVGGWERFGHIKSFYTEERQAIDTARLLNLVVGKKTRVVREAASE